MSKSKVIAVGVLAASLALTGQANTTRLNLPRREPSRLESHETNIPEIQPVPSGCQTPGTALLHFAIFRSCGLQHHLTQSRGARSSTRAAANPEHYYDDRAASALAAFPRGSTSPRNTQTLTPILP